MEAKYQHVLPQGLFIAILNPSSHEAQPATSVPYMLQHWLMHTKQTIYECIGF